MHEERNLSRTDESETASPVARRKRIGVGTIAVISLLMLSGCGTTTGDRMLSGGMLGAAGGAIIGAATGNPAAGAVIGAASGAFVGAVTDPCDLDLGSPYWHRHGGREAYEKRCGRHD